MRKTLYLKFIIGYVIFAVFGVIAVHAVVPRLARDQLTSDAAALLYREAVIISGQYATGLYNSDLSLDDVASQVMTIAACSDATIQIISPSGRIILSTGRNIDLDNPVYIDGFDPAATGDTATYYFVSNFFGCFDHEMLNVIAPITADFTTTGYLTVHSSLERIDSQCALFERITYLMLGILVALSLIILIFFTELVYLPLRKITRAAEEYAAGNMHYECQVESADEMGYLAACLNFMAAQIAHSEDVQKKFVANVSHDFKSPLTSIGGYIEAILDGTVPADKQQHYLQIVLDETARLKKLTGSMLTLNSLNTEGMVLNRTDFDINKIIRNAAASLEVQCKKKGISIDLVLTDNELEVNADVERIRQVLYNLLDNAVKFSKSGGHITVETTVRHDKLLVSVRDEGAGISKQDIQYVWDRFYKSDSSRGKDKRGTGLGLSIVKEIIASHGEQINVTSEEGVGTEFTFTLKLCDSADA